jgi:hypothetical protein
MGPGKCWEGDPQPGTRPVRKPPEQSFPPPALGECRHVGRMKAGGSQSLLANEQQQQPQPLPNAYHGKAA